MPSPAKSRLAYLDWLRGLACVLMFQTHCYDAWLGGAARDSRFAMWSHLGGTFPAPLFLFLAGISVALAIRKSLDQGLNPGQVTKATIRRGAQVLGLGLLFRLQEFAISLGWAPVSDLFRVDVLNNIGISIMLMGVLSWTVLALRAQSSADSGKDVAPPLTAVENPHPYGRLMLLSAAVAAFMSILTPLLWTAWRPQFLPWQLETYINGVHNLGQPQPWLFPIFPWTAFAFAGLAVGLFLSGGAARRLGGLAVLMAGAAGVFFIYVAKFLDSRPVQLYPVYDFWHTSPNFFLIRAGFLLLFVLAAYAWCRWGPGNWGFSPLIQLGQTSLLVYWVHIEFVYGRFSILRPRSQTIAGATRGLITITLAMLALSILRSKWKERARGMLSQGKNVPAVRSA